MNDCQRERDADKEMDAESGELVKQAVNACKPLSHFLSFTNYSITCWLNKVVSIKDIHREGKREILLQHHTLKAMNLWYGLGAHA